MPSKIQLDENLWFLYTCLKSSDFKTIDFSAVGNITGLKATAARMRYARLRKQIESGTLIGTRGIPFTQPGNKKGNGKRKAENKKVAVKEEPRDFEKFGSEGDSEDDRPLAKRRGIKMEAVKQERVPISTGSQYQGEVLGQQSHKPDQNASGRLPPTRTDIGRPLYQQRKSSGKPEDFTYMAPYQAHFPPTLQEQGSQAMNWNGSGSWNDFEGQYSHWV